MPELGWNRRYWDNEYNWKREGEEWSESWGDSEAQWFGTLLPRIHGCLPAARILEIAPGFGRWTQFLIPQCSRYVGIDLSANCIEACKKRFPHPWKTRFYHNDGLSLERAKGRFDFVFSFDSLVHVEIDVVEAYIPQIVAKLSERGIAFIHHSNYALSGAAINHHARGESVDSERVAELIVGNGGRVLVQEWINWGGHEAIDCFTLFGRGSQASVPRPIVNMSIMQEAERAKEIFRSYALASRPRPGEAPATLKRQRRLFGRA